MMTNEQVSSDRNPNTQPLHPWEVCFEGPGFRFCIPITSTGPTIPVPGGASPANLALAAGELHGKLYRALLKSFEQAGKNRQRFLKGEIRQLVTAGLIRSDEVNSLDEIVGLTSCRGKEINVERLEKIYRHLVDTAGTPVAVAIAGIAVNSGGTQESEGGAIAGADVGGAIGGGLLGGLGGAILVGAISSFVASAGSDLDPDN